MRLVSQSEYARICGLWRSTITRQIALGIIPVHGPKRMVNPEEADRCRAELLHPFKGAKSGLRALEETPIQPVSEVDLLDFTEEELDALLREPELWPGWAEPGENPK